MENNKNSDLSNNIYNLLQLLVQNVLLWEQSYPLLLPWELVLRLRMVECLMFFCHISKSFHFLLIYVLFLLV